MHFCVRTIWRNYFYLFWGALCIAPQCRTTQGAKSADSFLKQKTMHLVVPGNGIFIIFSFNNIKNTIQILLQGSNMLTKTFYKFPTRFQLFSAIFAHSGTVQLIIYIIIYILLLIHDKYVWYLNIVHK